MDSFIKRFKNIPYSYYVIIFSILATLITVWAFTGLWPIRSNDYNSYAIQAKAWLDGHLDIGDDRPWLELAIYEGKYFVSFPPFPSYVLLPFAVFFGESTPDHFIALIVTLTGAIYAAKLYERLIGEKNTIFYTLFLYIASGLIFIGANGYVWFIAQNMCFTLSVMSLYYAHTGRGGLSLTFWACAVGCRPMCAVYAPMLIWILLNNKSNEIHKKKLSLKIITLLKKYWMWAVCPVIIAISYMLLNYKRFGSIIEFGHNYLPEFTNVETGQFDISYLVPNIKRLISLPSLNSDSHVVEFPTIDGFAFYIATPLFIIIFIAWIYAVIRKIKSDKNIFISVILIPVLVLINVFIICLHKTLGGWGFGNRYLLDTLPWLYYGFLLWKPRSDKFDGLSVPFMIFGAALNIAGTIAAYNYWI